MIYSCSVRQKKMKLNLKNKIVLMTKLKKHYNFTKKTIIIPEMYGGCCTKFVI